MVNLENVLFKKSYRPLTQQELSWNLPLLEEMFEEMFEFPANMTKFDNEIDRNDEIYRYVYQDIEKHNSKYFLYIKKGNKSAIKKIDQYNNIYICFIHRKHPRKFVPLIKYAEYKKFNPEYVHSQENDIDLLFEKGKLSGTIIV